MPAAVRKRQIADVAVELIASDGVEGATIARIAERARVSESALYRHFESRHQILLAAMDLVYEFIAEFFVFRPGVPVPEQLLEIGRRHTSLVASERYAIFDAFIEFLATPPALELRPQMASRQLTIIDMLADILRRGIADGTVQPQVDPELVSWELHGIYWSEDITHLMGLRRYMEDGFSHTLLAQTVDRISTSAGRVRRPEE
jgi:AcrR family transcriptional regulator